MSMYFGSRWAWCFGESDDGTWASVLDRLTKEQVIKGFEAMKQRDDVWPPNVVEFLRLCGICGTSQEPAHRPAAERLKALPRRYFKPSKEQRVDLLKRAGVIKHER